MTSLSTLHTSHFYEGGGSMTLSEIMEMSQEAIAGQSPN